MEGINWADLFNAMDRFLLAIAGQYGGWVYATLFLIFFSETGLVFMAFLPGDSLLFVAGTLAFGAVIIAESALSFLGFGIMPPVPTWGNMLNEARNSPLEYLFVQALSPGFMIFLTVLSINFIGDGLRDALDPRLAI